MMTTSSRRSNIPGIATIVIIIGVVIAGGWYYYREYNSPIAPNRATKNVLPKYASLKPPISHGQAQKEAYAVVERVVNKCKNSSTYKEGGKKRQAIDLAQQALAFARAGEGEKLKTVMNSVSTLYTENGVLMGAGVVAGDFSPDYFKMAALLGLPSAVNSVSQTVALSATQRSTLLSQEYLGPAAVSDATIRYAVEAVSAMSQVLAPLVAECQQPQTERNEVVTTKLTMLTGPVFDGVEEADPTTSDSRHVLNFYDPGFWSEVNRIVDVYTK